MQTPFDEYFYPIFGWGVVVATALSLCAGKARGWRLPLLCLMVGIFSFWVTLFIGSEVGYQMWQNVSNPPEEAFADSFPMGALLIGWLPGIFYCGFVFGITKLVPLLVSKRAPHPSQPPVSTARTESENPFQGP
ncbi:MAG: hypothetical protein ACR2NK_19090 [Mariniblastus sp.]